MATNKLNLKTGDVVLENHFKIIDDNFGELDTNKLNKADLGSAELATKDKTIKGAINELNTSLNDKASKSDLGTATLATTDKTIKGAINELNTSLGNKLNKTDLGSAELATTDKTVKGAINEINKGLADKASKSDLGTVELTTTDKTIKGAINEINAKTDLGSAELATTDKTIKGAINELNTGLNNKLNKTDLGSAELATTDKTVKGAINELNTGLNNKANKADLGTVELTTTDKTIKGAINEINAKIVSSASEISEGLGSSLNQVSLYDCDFYKGLFKKGICIGDSITEGYRDKIDDVYKSKSYPAFLSRISNWELINAGEQDCTPTWLWKNKVSSYKYEECDFVIIKLGQKEGLTDTLDKDVTGDSYSNYADTNTGNYCKIIEYIKEKNPAIKIFLVSVQNQEDLVTNTVIKKISDKYKLQYIDLDDNGIYTLTDSNYHTSNDGVSYGVHFNTIGYLTLAKVIYMSIISYINKNYTEFKDF